jgi:hypothetical protein
MDVEINYWAVLIAGLSSMVVGSIWYMPGMFGKTWIKLTGVKMNKKMSNGDAAALYGLTLVASLVTAYILAHVAFLSHHFFNNSFLQDTVTTAFWLWLGFTAARFLVHDLFESRPKQLTLLNVSHEFATVIVMALIIGAIGI